MRLTLDKTKTVKVPNDPDNGFINIRALSNDEIAEIESKSMSLTVGQGNEASLELDPYARDNGVAAACLQGWGNMFDPSGKALEYNKQNIELARRKFSIDIDGVTVRFFKWIRDEHDQFIREINEGKEEVAGN